MVGSRKSSPITKTWNAATILWITCGIKERTWNSEILCFSCLHPFSSTPTLFLPNSCIWKHDAPYRNTARVLFCHIVTNPLSYSRAPSKHSHFLHDPWMSEVPQFISATLGAFCSRISSLLLGRCGCSILWAGETVVIILKPVQSSPKSCLFCRSCVVTNICLRRHQHSLHHWAPT